MAKYELAEHPFSGWRLYKIFHKGEGRWYAHLTSPDYSTRQTMSLARYLMSVKLGRKLTKNEQVGHINNDKSDDRIENLQILSIAENIKKSSKGRTTVELICGFCNKTFRREKRQLHPSKANQSKFCSRNCLHESLRRK